MIGHPRVLARRLPPMTYALRHATLLVASLDAATLPAGACVLEIPLDSEEAVRILYFLPHPAVESALRERALRTFPIDRGP